MAKKEYQKGTVVEVLDRDDKGNPTSHIESDPHGTKWHVEKGKDPVQLRDEEEVNALR